MSKKIRNFFTSMKIREKLVASFALLLSVPLLILGMYSFYQAKENLDRQCVETMKNNLNSVVSELDSRFSDEATYSRYLAYNLNFRKLLEQESVDRVALAMELNRSVEPMLWYYITSDNYMKGIQIYSDRVDRSLGSFLQPVSACESPQWYDYHKQQQGDVWTYRDGNLFLSRSILDTTTVSRTIAVIRLDMFAGTFLQPLDELNYLDNGILVLDEQGSPVYERPTRAGSVDDRVRREIAAGNLGSTSEYLLFDSTIPSSGWQVYYYVDQLMVTGQLFNIVERTLLVVAGIIVLAIALISLLSRTLSHRILLLQNYAGQVAAGNLELEIHSEDTDEIGVVINSFGSMTRRLNQTINEIYKMKLEQKEIELSALQAQINPHFLYNALSSIKWKALRQGNEDISDLTSLLATFYRTSLNNGQTFTTVKSELDNIRAYIELQQHMHDFPFTVEYQIDPDALPLKMLNFLLQPVVENAIKHGIDYTDETGDGKIIIQCLLDGDFLVFHIKNNGPVIQENAIQNAMMQPGKGYGIYNIRERISLYYGETCGLSAEIGPDGYTCFTVRILKDAHTPGNNNS